MTIYHLNIPYNNFEVGKLIDPSEFNSNNGAIQSKINEIIGYVNTFQIVNSDGEIVIPNFLTQTAILPTEIQSPTLTGNTLIGVSGLVGMSSVGTTASSIRIWAGDPDRNYAPFRVAQDGTVTMTKANIQTKADENGLYIAMDGSKIIGGRADQPEMYTIGTASLSSGSRSGVFQSKTYLTGDNTPDYTMQVTHNSIMVTGANLVMGGSGESRAVVITRNIGIGDHEAEVPANAALHVKGNINLTGDIYVNGVKMALTPA